jgi:hypothetical protein
LAGKIYKVERTQLSVVLAFYEEGPVLWLDDHTGEADFETFMKREELKKWLPHQMAPLLDLLIETKFNFLGRPQLIHSATDIPKLTQKQIDRMSKSKDAMAKFHEKEKLLAKITDQIQPPVCHSNNDQEFQISFYIWTKILGNILRIDCFFRGDHGFSYELTQLGDQIGAFIVPR